MPESTVTARPAWVEEIVQRYGEPAVDCTEPIVFVDRTRRCWVWSVGGHNFNIVIDTYPTGSWRAQTAVNGPGRNARLYAEPTDDDIRAMCAFVWPTFREDHA